MIRFYHKKEVKALAEIDDKTYAEAVAKGLLKPVTTNGGEFVNSVEVKEYVSGLDLNKFILTREP